MSKRLVWIALVVLAVAVLAGQGTMHAQSIPTPTESLLALSKTETSLAIVDPRSLKIVAKIPVGEGPHEVIASADGRRAYVSNYANGAGNTIAVINLREQKLETTIDLGSLYGPHGLTFVGGKLWFTAEREKLIARLDPATNKVDWQLGTGQIGTHMLWVSPDQKHFVTVSVGSGTITLISPYTLPADLRDTPLSKYGSPTTRGADGTVQDWSENVIQIGTNPEGFDVLRDRAGNPSTIWAANALEGTISIIDAKTLRVQTVPAGVSGANRLRFTPNGRLALISGDKLPEVYVFDVATHSVIKRIAIGTGGAGIVMAPDGSRAFVSGPADNYVTAIDLGTLTAVGKVDVGKMPDGLAWAMPGDPNGGVSP